MTPEIFRNREAQIKHSISEADKVDKLIEIVKRESRTEAVEGDPSQVVKYLEKISFRLRYDVPEAINSQLEAQEGYREWKDRLGDEAYQCAREDRHRPNAPVRIAIGPMRP